MENSHARTTAEAKASAWLAAAALLLSCASSSHAQVEPRESILHFDFSQGLSSLAEGGGTVELREGLKRDEEGWLEFTTARQHAQVDLAGMRRLSGELRKVKSLSVGAWCYVRRVGEQAILSRGEIEIGALGERFFRPSERLVNFCLGSDDRGFLMGAINGNGSMPFVQVTINDLPIMTWQQLVLVKDEEGFHHFYQNGAKAHDDRNALWAPSRQGWRETDAGLETPLRLQMPMGGRIGEAWIVGRALSEEEIAADYQAKRSRYRPAPPGRPVALREMHSRPPAEAKPFEERSAREALLKLFGPFPEKTTPLDPQVLSEEDCGSYLRRKVSLQVQPQDRMPAYLLIPKRRPGRIPAVVCFYGTTSGAGKLTTVGLSGNKPGSPPHPNRSFAVDLAEAGVAALAPDYLRDGERIAPGDAPYNTRRFYEQFPDWSIHGKDVWDTMRAIDYLQSLDFVDPEAIGMIGHSYGGHSTLFAAALEPRIKAAVANGPVSAFREHGMHWGVPKGAGNSQSLPAMRPYLLDPDLPLPITFAEVTALVAPRPLWVGQAAGERRPLEEENTGFVQQVYRSRRASDRVRYVWYAGDHDFPPPARAAAVEWLKRWLAAEE